MKSKKMLCVAIATLVLTICSACASTKEVTSGDTGVSQVTEQATTDITMEEPTETLVPTDASTQTDKPQETAIPENTEEATGESQETETPQETGESQETEKPQETGKPQETEKPQETGKPQETEKPQETPQPTNTPQVTSTPIPEPTETPGGDDDRDGLTGKTATEIVADMGFGFNIGNTLDANSGKVENVLDHEVAWGNPVITQELVDGIVSAGFTTIRIPTTWMNFIDENNYTIDPAYLARVKEVVDYCYKHEVYIILNTHHEDWIENPDLIKDKEKIAKMLSAVWSQIADYFAEYDQHLIFEGVNEPRLKGTDVEWTGNAEGYAVMNYLSQVFVDTVRSNGKGYNDERCLMITGYAASNSASVMKAISIPTYAGEAVNNLIVSVHSYAPYEFCLNTKQKTFDLNNATDTGAIDSVFAAIKAEFLDHDIPVIIGETGVTGKEDEQSRINWITYMGTKAAEHGTPIILWDNGAPGTGSENHCYFDRDTGELIAKDFVNTMIHVKNNTQWGKALAEEEEPEVKSLVGGQVIVSYQEGKTSEKEWDYTYISTTAEENYFYGERSIAVVYTGKGEPKMVLDSSELNQWWMPVDPDKIESVGDKKVAYFSAAKIKSTIESYGVTNYAQLRNMSFLAANGSITTYEVAAIGKSVNVLFKVNGATYYAGTDMPKDPVVDNMKFLGWYSTKDYRPGTEYNGKLPDKDLVVYAKFAY